MGMAPCGLGGGWACGDLVARPEAAEEGRRRADRENMVAMEVGVGDRCEDNGWMRCRVICPCIVCVFSLLIFFPQSGKKIFVVFVHPITKARVGLINSPTNYASRALDNLDSQSVPFFSLI